MQILHFYLLKKIYFCLEKQFYLDELLSGILSYIQKIKCWTCFEVGNPPWDFLGIKEWVVCLGFFCQ